MLALELAQEIQELVYSEIPLSAVAAAKRCIIDTIGVIVKGSTYDSSAILAQTLDSITDLGKCTLAGKVKKTVEAEAALFNGTAAHSVEMDDFHREAAVHPGVVVIPAALAVAEKVGASGADFIRAVVVGYEVMIRVGKACNGTPYERGFHPTAICGPFGAAAAAGILYGLSIEQLANALGIAGSFTGGLLEYKSNGAWTKRLNAGLAARTGVFAAKLAQSGFTGPLTILEGRFGFLKAYSNRFTIDPLKPTTGAVYAIEEVSFKPYSSCRFTHAPIDAFAQILQNQVISQEKIENILVETHDMALKATMEPADRKYRPETVVDAQFSIPYCLALQALYGAVVPDLFTGQYLTSNVVLTVAQKVTGKLSQEFDSMFPAKNACRVTVHTKDGIYSAEVLDAKGDPENPLSLDDLENKFRALAHNILPQGKAEQLVELVNNLESLDDVKLITTLLA